MSLKISPPLCFSAPLPSHNANNPDKATWIALCNPLRMPDLHSRTTKATELHFVRTFIMHNQRHCVRTIHPTQQEHRTLHCQFPQVLFSVRLSRNPWEQKSSPFAKRSLWSCLLNHSAKRRQKDEMPWNGCNIQENYLSTIVYDCTLNVRWKQYTRKWHVGTIMADECDDPLINFGNMRIHMHEENGSGKV
jgi:hypothetical protein